MVLANLVNNRIIQLKSAYRGQQHKEIYVDYYFFSLGKSALFINNETHFDFQGALLQKIISRRIPTTGVGLCSGYRKR